MSVHKDDKTGKWFYTFRYNNAFGEVHVKKKRGYRTKREAQKAEAKAKEDVSQYGYEDMTLSKLYELYMSHNRRISESTRFLRSEYWKDAIAPKLGEMKLTMITHETIDAWIDWLLEKHSASTARMEKAFLSQLFNFGVRRGYCMVNPVLQVEPIKKDVKEKAFWEVSEFEAFIHHACPDMRLLFCFLFYTGCRVGEMQALQWSDFDGRSVSITKTVTRDRNGKSIIGECPKTQNSVRSVTLPEWLCKALNEKKKADSSLDGFNDGYLIFGGYQIISADKIRYEFKKGIAKSGVKSITLHGLRHSHASYLIAKGLPDIMIAKRLGHTVTQLYNTYAHVYTSLENRMTEAVDNMPFPKNVANLLPISGKTNDKSFT